MPLSAGSYTFGPGGDFAGFAAIAAAINGTSVTSNLLSGNLTFTQIGNIIEAGFPTFEYIAMNGFTWKFTSDTPHFGRPNTSWKTTAQCLQFLNTIRGAGLLYFEDVYIEATTYVNIINAQCPVRICKSLYRNTYAFGKTALSVQGSINIEISDSKFWCTDSAPLIVGVKGASSSGYLDTQILKLENVSAWGSPISLNYYMIDIVYASDTTNSYVKNCIGFTSGTGHGFTFPPYTGNPAIPQSANAGNGVNQGQTPAFSVSAADFTSLDVTNNNFMNTDPSSALYVAGVAPAIACNPRSAPYPIGTTAFIVASNPPWIQDTQFLCLVARRLQSMPKQFRRNAVEYIPVPLRSSLLPGATANLSHARILRAYRNSDDAAVFHTIMKEAS